MNEIGWPTIDSKHLMIDSKQMLILEKEMFSDGMPQEALMEKAGIKVSLWLLKRKQLLKHGVTVVIGPGHNFLYKRKKFLFKIQSFFKLFKL